MCRRSKMHLSQRLADIKEGRAYRRKRDGLKTSSSSSIHHDITVLDLMRNIDEKSYRLKNSDLEKYMNREVLEIARNWSKAVVVSADFGNSSVAEFSKSTPSCEIIHYYGLSTECATLEVEAISVLAVIEQRLEKESNTLTRIKQFTDYRDDMDDNEMENELQNLSQFENNTREEIRLA